MTDAIVHVKVIPEIDEEALLAAVLKVISGHAVVKPGETLVIRHSQWTPEQAEQYQQWMDYQHDHGKIPFRALVVIGEELGVVRPDPFTDKAAQRGG